MQRLGVAFCALVVALIAQATASAAWPTTWPDDAGPQYAAKDSRYKQAYNNTVHEFETRPNPASPAATNLTTITTSNPNLIWKGGIPGGQVLMSCFTDYPVYTRHYSEDPASPYYSQTPKWRPEVWLAAAPELHSILSSNHYSSDEAALRTKQLLGMPASHPGNRVVEFWISPESLFRPAVDPSITRADSALTPPTDFSQYTIRYENSARPTFDLWQQRQFRNAYGTQNGNIPYPWSDLGYTYDWRDPSNPIGLSEFVGKYNDQTNADPSLWVDNPVEVYAVVSIGSYGYYDRQGNFDVIGNCDTIWAGDLYTPVSAGGNWIYVAPGATVYEGITVSSGGFSVTNAGTILGPGRNLNNSYRDSTVQFEQGGNLFNSGLISGAPVGVSVDAGDSYIENSGTIRGSQYAIRSGDGADQIVNSGLLDGRVSTGGGDDQILLLGGSVTGHMDGGAGANTVIFDPGAGNSFVYHGNLVSFQDVQLLSGAIRLNGQVSAPTVVVPVGVTLGGVGTYLGSLCNFGTVAPGNSIGTMYVQGDYEQAAGSLLQISLTKPAESVFSASRLVVGGNATLDPASAIEVNYVSGGQSAIRHGDLFTILSAGGTLTLGPGGEAPPVVSQSGFLGFTGVQAATNGQSWFVPKLFQLRVSRIATFASAAAGRNDRSLAAALDLDGDSAQGPFGSLVNDLLFMSASQFSQSVGQLSPAPYLTVSASTFRTAQYVADDLAGYLQGRRLGVASPVGVAGVSVTDDATGMAPASLTEQILAESAKAQQATVVRQQNADGRAMGFVKPVGLFFGERSAGEHLGFRANGPGILAGMDRPLDDNCILGIGLGYVHTDLRVAEDRGWGDIDTLRVGPYLTWFSDDWFLDLSALYGHHDNDIRRRVDVGSLQELAVGRYVANDISLYLGGGLNLGLAEQTFAPTASLQYTYYAQPGFTETNAPGAGLDVDPLDAHSLRSKVGVQIHRSSLWRNVVLTRQFFGGWAHEYLADQALGAQFAAGATSFTTEPIGLFRDSGYFGASLAAMPRDNLTFFLHYHGELSSGGDFHAADVGLGLQF